MSPIRLLGSDPKPVGRWMALWPNPSLALQASMHDLSPEASFGPVARLGNRTGTA